MAAKTRLGLIEVSTRSTRAVVLPDDDLATLFFERGDELVACGPIGVERGAPSVADAAADVVAWARGREAFVWRGLFAADPTLDEPLKLPADAIASARGVSRITALALSQSVLFASCAGASSWGGWDLTAAGRGWFDAPAHDALADAQILALGGDVLSVLYANGRAQFDVSDPRRPRLLDAVTDDLDERGWSPFRAVASGEWIVTLESKESPLPADAPRDGAAVVERVLPVYSLGVYRWGGSRFAGRVLLSADSGAPSSRPAIDALDERLLLAERRRARLIDLRRLDQRLRDADASLADALLDDATMVERPLEAEALDARLFVGAGAAVSVSVPPSAERLARINARRNPWEPSGLAMPRARVVRLSWGDS